MLKEIGALCVVTAASVMGFGFAGSVRQQTRQLAAMIDALTFLKSEILYRRTPLPEAFPLVAAAAQEQGTRAFFRCCGREMRTDRTMSAMQVFRVALGKTAELRLPLASQQTLLTLGASLGEFDLDGQSRAVELALARLGSQLHRLEQGSGARRRSYATIGVCAGLAVAVILL